MLSRASTHTVTREHTYYHARTHILSRANTHTITREYTNCHARTRRYGQAHAHPDHLYQLRRVQLNLRPRVLLREGIYQYRAQMCSKIFTPYAHVFFFFCGPAKRGPSVEAPYASTFLKCSRVLPRAPHL